LFHDIEIASPNLLKVLLCLIDDSGAVLIDRVWNFAIKGLQFLPVLFWLCLIVENQHLIRKRQICSHTRDLRACVLETDLGAARDRVGRPEDTRVPEMLPGLPEMLPGLPEACETGFRDDVEALGIL
jgi:hypothetical protein